MTQARDPSPSQPGLVARGLMATADSVSDQSPKSADWKTLVQKFQKSSRWRASWQLLNTVGTYVALWVLIGWTLRVSWWLAVPLSVLAGLFLVRVFIIFHDCGHGSFFASRRANSFWGFVTGLLTFTPYYHWRGDHAVHHGTTGDLGQRGVGDLWTMTVHEYLASTRWKKIGYRLVRNPFVLFGLAPLLLMLVLQRFPRAGAGPSERRSVWIMNAAVVAMAVGIALVVGFLPYLVVQLIIVMVAGSVGIWLFYLQHQFEAAYWERGKDWNYVEAALKGSSYFKLPRVLQWFSGNIGFHHIHHLSPRIPNYYLEACHRSDPLFSSVAPMSIWAALRALGLKVWDESTKKLVGWREVRELRRQFRSRNRSSPPPS